MSITVVKALIALYAIISLITLIDKNIPLTLYFIGATVLTVGVLLMIKGGF